MITLISLLEDRDDAGVQVNFEKLAITKVKETSTYRAASVMWNGRLIGYIIYDKSKGKHIAKPNDKGYPHNEFDSEESAIEYLKRGSTFTISSMGVMGGGEEGSSQKWS